MRKTIRLIWQLYPTYLLITLIALGAVSWYASNFLSDYFFERTFADLKTQARILQVQVDRHLEIGVRAVEIMRDLPSERLHSRKLRSFNEVPFQ